MELGGFLKMQHTLAVEKGWMKDRDPDHGAYSLLWSIDELGEAISIIKKKGAEGIMDTPAVRERFVEEVADHFMYLFDMMECFGITAEEFTDVYVKKFERNLGRSWTENERMYEENRLRELVVSERFLPDERLWELIMRAGARVTVVAEKPEQTAVLLDSLVNDAAKIALTDTMPEIPGAFVVDSAESYEALKTAFGEE